MSVNSNGYIHFGGNIRNIYILLLFLSFFCDLYHRRKYIEKNHCIKLGSCNKFADNVIVVNCYYLHPRRDDN